MADALALAGGWVVATCVLLALAWVATEDIPVGTRSVLYGAHAFWLHPWFVAWAWWKLYGFPWDPRLWVAFFVHDLGYWGSPNMDGEEGERHPEWGAEVVTRLFDRRWTGKRLWLDEVGHSRAGFGPWGRLVLLHSRFYAKALGQRPSRLCIADKLAICLTPAWLYLPMVRATGEIREYMQLSRDAGEEGAKYASMDVHDEREAVWYRNVQDSLRRWVEEHQDGRPDTWTPDAREARDESGVWS